MRALEALFAKKKKLVIGLMSGTSADGIDACLAEIDGSGTSTRMRQLAFATYPFPGGYRDLLLKNSDPRTARLDDIARLNILAAELFAGAARRIARSGGRPIASVDLIGSHGQTIRHLPAPVTMFGKEIRSTLQIGHPSLIAARTGVVTVADFRIADIAAGGSGAPLVPLFDYLLFRSPKETRILLNIGGIANMTILPRGCKPREVAAFDTGPGNMVIDALMRRLYGRPFDRHGAVAAKGRILPRLLSRLSQHPYLALRPPKSTGREMFGKEFVAGLLAHARGADPADIVATATEFTALAIYRQYAKFWRPRFRADALLVSGGGARNRFLMETLARYFSPVAVRPTDDLRISSRAKEALCFALLANETVSGHPGNLPGATGASRPATLGVIAVP